MKSTFISWWIWTVIVAASIIVPRCAFGASYSFVTTTGDSIRLTDTPCEVSVGWLKLWKAVLRYQGKDYEACWALVGSTVVVFDSAGDISPIDKSAFKKDTGV